MNTLQPHHASTILMHGAFPPAVALHALTLQHGPVKALELVLAGHAPQAVLRNFHLPVQTLQRDVDQLRAGHVRLLTPDDSLYPTVLPRRLPGRDVSALAPDLWIRGYAPATALDGGVAIVGSSHPNPFGLDLTTHLTRKMLACGRTIILAGIGALSQAALRAAFASNLSLTGRLIVVLDHDPSTVMDTTDRGLLRHVRAEGGLLVSEYPRVPHTALASLHARDRLVGALATTIVVVEPKPHSGALDSVTYTAKALDRQVYRIHDPNNLPPAEGVNE